MPQLPAFAKYSYIVSALFLLLVSIYRVLVPHIVGKYSRALGKSFPTAWEKIPYYLGTNSHNMREYFPTICGTTGTNRSLQATIRCLIYLFSLVYPFRSILFMCAILRMRTRVPACNIIMCISFTVSSPILL